MSARGSFEYNANGQHRIRIGTAESEWAYHTKLARLTINGTDYYGASLYHLGDLPCERVFSITTLPTTVTEGVNS